MNPCSLSPSGPSNTLSETAPIPEEVEESQRKPSAEAATLGFVLLIYVVLLATPIFRVWGEAWHMLFTNGWLCLGVLFYARRVPIRRIRLAGPWSISAISCALAIVFFLALNNPPNPGQNIHWHVFSKLLLIILVPIAEESYFRGALLEHITTHMNESAAVFLASLLFALMHYYTAGWFLMMPFSVILCAITLQLRHVGGAIVLHALWNILVVFQ